MNRAGMALIGGLVWMLTATTAPAQMMPMPGGGGTGPQEKKGMQEGMGMQQGMGMHEGMGMDGGMMGMKKTMMALKHLDLTPEQLKKIQSLRIQHQKEAIPLFAKVRMAGVEIEELMMADPVNMEKVKAKTKEKYGSMADLEVSHLSLEQKIKAVLTPEQRQSLEMMEMKMGAGMGHATDRPKQSLKGSPGEMPMGPNMKMPSPGSAAPETDDPEDQ